MAAAHPTLLRRAALAALLAAPRLAGAQARDEATVRATQRRELTRVTLTRDELRVAPGSFGDPLRALQNLPGLARAPLFSGSLIVRGATPADTAVLVDGTTLPSAYHYGGLGSTVSPEMIERIDFSPGNFSARYGRATGGVVDIALRDPGAGGARSTLHLSTLDLGAFVEAPLSPRAGVAAAARFGWLGLLLSPVVSALTPYDLTLGYWDYQAVGTWRPTARDQLRLAVYGCGDSVALADAGGAVGGGLGFHLAQLRWTRALGDDATLTVSLSAGWNGLAVTGRPTGSSTIPTSAAAVRIDGALDAGVAHLRAELSRRVSPRVLWRVGFDGVFGARRLAITLRLPTPMPGPGGEGTSREDLVPLAQPAAYAELDLALSARVHLRPGVRFEASAYTGAATLSPRVTLDARAWPGGLVKLGAGTFTQPALDERVAIGSEQLLYLAEVTVARRAPGPDTRPRPERALHLGVGVEQQVGDGLSIHLDGFYKVIDDALVGLPSLDRALSGAVEEVVPIRYTGQGRAYGAELLARYTLPGRVSAWVAYTLMRAERRESPRDLWWLYEFDQTHIFTAMATVALGRGWSVGARFRYVTGRPSFAYAPLFDATTGADLFAPLQAQERAPDFHQLDLRAEKTWALRWGSLSVSLEVVNAYNRLNAEAYDRDRDRTVTVAAGPFIPFFPNLGVRGVL